MSVRLARRREHRLHSAGATYSGSRTQWMGVYFPASVASGAAASESLIGTQMGGKLIYWGGGQAVSQATMQEIADAGCHVVADYMTKASSQAAGTGFNAYIGYFAEGSGSNYDLASAWIDSKVDSAIIFATWLQANHPSRWFYVSCEHEYDVKLRYPTDQLYTGTSLDGTNGGRFMNAFYTRLKAQAVQQGLTNIILCLWWGSGSYTTEMNTIMAEFGDGLFAGQVMSLDPYLFGGVYETPTQTFMSGLTNLRVPSGGSYAQWQRIGAPHFAITETAIAVQRKNVTPAVIPFTAEQIAAWYTDMDALLDSLNLEFITIFLSDTSAYDLSIYSDAVMNTSAARAALGASVAAVGAS